MGETELFGSRVRTGEEALSRSEALVSAIVPLLSPSSIQSESKGGH